MIRRASPFTPPSSPAFTLVEILIVVIILALLSAIILPQISDSVKDSKLSALMSNLMLIRKAIDRYQIDHSDWPGSARSSGGNCSNGGSAGIGAPNTAQALAEQLSYYTNPEGQTCSTRDTSFKYGPYLRDQQIPANPLSGSNIVNISTNGELGLKSARVDGLGGWLYDVETGQFSVDDAAYNDW